MVRGGGGSLARGAPGTGGLSFGIEARGGGESGGGTGAGAAAVLTTGVTGDGVSTACIPGDEGRTSGAGGFVALGSAVTAGISRDARAITPGVKVGVGLRALGIAGLSGVA